MDYRKFLHAKQTLTLPFLGGGTVHAADRRLRVQTPVAVGWWRFEILRGRHATPLAPTDAPSLDHCPALRGHLVGHWMFCEGHAAVRVFLTPDDEETPALTPICTRRWPGNAVLFESVEFETEVEDGARDALINNRHLGPLRGASPALRRAFGYAHLLRGAAQRGLRISVREVWTQLAAVADGDVESSTVLDALEARVYAVSPGSLHRGRAPVTRRRALGDLSPAERAAAALEGAGATLLDSRTTGAQMLEVVFRYLGEQFIAVVDTQTLHVYDAGICLDGADEQLGLDSLPSVISEAVDAGLLYITRR